MSLMCLPGQRRPWLGRLAQLHRAQPALETLESRSSPSMLGPTRTLADITPNPLRAMTDLASASAMLARAEPSTAEAARDTLTSDFWTLDRLAEAMQPLAMPTALASITPPHALDSAGIQARASNQGPARLDDTNDPPPVISDFGASEGTDRWWTFEGHVDAVSPGAMIIEFGGLPSLQNQTVNVNDHGDFTFTIQLANCEEGMATAQTTDWNGQVSNVAEDFVHQTGCVIGNTHPG